MTTCITTAIAATNATTPAITIAYSPWGNVAHLRKLYFLVKLHSHSPSFHFLLFYVIIQIKKDSRDDCLKTHRENRTPIIRVGECLTIRRYV